MKFPWFCWSIFDGGFWFRVFGYGVRVIDRRKYPPVFSQRPGQPNCGHSFGKWNLLLLRPKCK